MTTHPVYRLAAPSADRFLSPRAIRRCWRFLALLAIFCQGDHLFAQQTAAPDVGAPAFRLTAPRLVSEQNRKQDGVVFGGWGPHLRSILRMNDDSLWYVMDHSRGDVSSNDQIYYLRQKDASWEHVADQDLIPGANQGYAHITDGEEIFSYGVNFKLAQLHECRLNSKTLVGSGCAAVLDRSGQAIDLGGGANYIGAAISPQGTRLAWWVVVARDGGQEWRYVYNRGEGWEGPIITRLDESHRGFSYIYARFVDATEVALSGQVWVGEFPKGSAQATLTRFSLGQPIQGFHALTSPDKKGFPKSGGDLWVNPRTGTVHAVVEGFGEGFFGATIHYYTFNIHDPWRELAPIRTFSGYFRARFAELVQGDLCLVLGGSTDSPKLEALRVPKDGVTDPIDWDAADKVNATMPAGEHYAPMAIWIENRAYQTTPVKNLNFAFTGENPDHDHEIWFYSGASP